MAIKDREAYEMPLKYPYVEQKGQAKLNL